MKLYKSLSELPKEEKGSAFWNVATSPELREIIVFQLINGLASGRSQNLTDAQCRSKLAQLEGKLDLLYMTEGKQATLEAAKKSERFDEIPQH